MTRDRSRLAIDAALSAVLAAVFFALWPASPLLDDAAIVLRYVDHFAAGHPFAYNPEDGPVFGVSGFLHGLLAGTVAWLGLATPRGALAVSNVLGLGLAGFLVLRILGRFTPDRRLVLAAWPLAMIASPYFVLAAPSGLETPLHVAVVLAACLAYLRGAALATWLLGALAVVSKLDAVPVVATLVAARAHDVWREGRPWRPEARALLLGLAAPLAAWVAVATALFGGPLPQSAYAKVRYLRAAEEGWLPFLRPFTDGARATLLTVAAVACLAVALWLLAARRPAVRRPGLARPGQSAVFGVAAAGVVALYCWMNPVERHLWYYALPELLMVLQVLCLACGLTGLARGRRRRRWRAALAAACVLALAPAGYLLARTARPYLDYLDEAESERLAIGRFVGERSRRGDVLFTGHGHVAREARLYTIDHSGLNSRVATDAGLDHPRLLRAHRPDWVVESGLLPAALQAELRYRLVRSWYNPLLRDGAAYRLYHREPGRAPSVALAATLADVPGGRLVRLPVTACRALALGVVLADAEVEASVWAVAGGEERLVDRRRFPARRRHPAQLTAEWRVALPPRTSTLAVRPITSDGLAVVDAVATDCRILAPPSAAFLPPSGLPLSSHGEGAGG